MIDPAAEEAVAYAVAHRRVLAKGEDELLKARRVQQAMRAPFRHHPALHKSPDAARAAAALLPAIARQHSRTTKAASGSGGAWPTRPAQPGKSLETGLLGVM